MQEDDNEASKFYFVMEEFLISNELVPEYLQLKTGSVDKDLDFWKKTECVYMGDSPIKGILILKKDSIIFRTKTGLGRSNIKALQKLDDELFEKEIS